jgi:riboflavin biosynthesis pyrimidine reductase
MAFDPTAADNQLNTIIADVNNTLGTHLKFISTADLIAASNNPQSALGTLVAQVTATPAATVGAIATALTSDPARLQSAANIVSGDLQKSPDLQAAFSQARSAITPNEVVNILAPLGSVASIPVAGGGTVLGSLFTEASLLHIKL